jgi:hypothetical protein
MGELYTDALLKAAIQRTGIERADLSRLKEGLDVLTESMRSEARLSPAGERSQHAALIAMLSNRLRLDALFAAHPAIEREVIPGPIVIVGLPRSGTTKLHRLLAVDEQFQWLPLWRILNPAPMHAGVLPADERDPRIAIAEAFVDDLRRNHPDFHAGHPMEAMAADEEVFMADLVLRGWNPCYSLHVPSYQRWLEAQDFSVWYAQLRRLLQLFQWQDGAQGKTWLLKTCEHLGYLPHLLSVFPRATVVHCHRDPVTSVASLAALTAASRRMHSEDAPMDEAGRFVIEHLSRQMRAYLWARAELEGDHRFVDVAYKEIVGDILPAIERIYDAARIPLSAATRTQMRAWERANPADKHGRHRYSLSDTGLTEREVRESFGDYLQRFAPFL